MYFADGLVYKERKFKCSMIKTDKEQEVKKEVKLLELPKNVMKWNHELYRRMIQEENRRSRSDDLL